MNITKSPGGDGLTVEFYKCFWKEIKELVVGSLNRGFQKGELSLGAFISFFKSRITFQFPYSKRVSG